MKEFLFLAVGFLVGVILTKALDSPSLDLPSRRGERFRGNDRREPINPQQVKQKQEHLERVLDLARQNAEITNDLVEKTLGVSNATAERYLQDLEDRGKLRQIGTHGKYVTYKAV